MIKSATLLITLTALGLMTEPISDRPLFSGKAVVHDGDSIRIGDRKIRLYGIDAPELEQPCHKEGKAWNCGQAARNELVKLLNGREVHCQQKERDRYKRIIATCFIGTGSAMIDIATFMAANGWAVAYTRYSVRYVAAETYAVSKDAGIWGSDFRMPEDWRRNRS